MIGSVILANHFLIAQTDTLQISRAQAENLFLDKNLELLAGKLNIDIAEAEVIQAKLWPNPTLSVSEVNLWNTGTKHSEAQPYLAGTWGEYTQVGVELEQLIYTAGKRKKLVAMEKANVEVSKSYLEELLRNLKFEFRNSLTELQYLQNKEKIYRQLTEQIRPMINGFKNQYAQKNISQSELVRLQSLEVQFNREMNEIFQEKNKIIKELKTLMALPATVYLVLNEEGFIPDQNQLASLNESELLLEALESRPDLKANQLETDYFHKKLTYEKSLRKPDLTFSINYDRGGNIMRDFVGLGISMDLPFFDRNQGNIKIAEFEINQSQLNQDQKKLQIQSEVVKELHNLQQALALNERIDPNYENNLENLLPAYQRNFMDKNISLLEYIDFIESFVDSKESILEMRKNIHAHYEELEFIIGKEL